METQDRICRLCLNETRSNFNDIGENIKKRLGVLLLEVNLDVSEKPMLCTNCTIALQKCYDFKSTCLATKECIIAFVNEDDAKLDMKDIYISFKGNGSVECTTGDYTVCCFCMGVNFSFVSLAEEDVISEKIMLEKCLPDLDINIIKKPTICVPCHGCLQDYFMFVTNCMRVEETIKKYCKSEDTNSSDQIELIDVLEFSLKNVLNENGDTAKVIKKEDQQHEGEIWKEELCDDMEITETEVAQKYANVVKTEKSDSVLLSNNTLMYSEEVQCVKIEGEFWEEGETETKPITERFMKLEDRKFLLHDKEIEIKSDQHAFNSSQDGVVSPQLSKSYDMPHTSTKKNVSDVKRHRCTSCSYQTNKKSNLTGHLLVHKSPSEVPIYKCGFCSYQVRNKHYLKKHLLVHKDPSEITMYKCEMCPYRAKQSCHLRKHLLVHKVSSTKVIMYKCNVCSYQARRASYVTTHLKTHKNPLLDTTMYKCNSCPFQTKSKESLHKHNITFHKNPSK